MLFFNSETWTNIQPKTIRIINSLFNDFHTSIFRIGKGIPIPNMYRICGTLLPVNIILQRKLNFIFHVANLESGSVARDIYEVQKRQSTGLYKETKEHVDKLGITCLHSISKYRFRALTKKYIFEKNKSDLINMARNYKKIDLEEFQKDSFTRKEYFNSLNLNDIRYKCRIEMQMLPTIRKNQPSKYRKRNMSLSCPSSLYMTNASI